MHAFGIERIRCNSSAQMLRNCCICGTLHSNANEQCVHFLKNMQFTLFIEVAQDGILARAVRDTKSCTVYKESATLSKRVQLTGQREVITVSFVLIQAGEVHFAARAVHST